MSKVMLLGVAPPAFLMGAQLALLSAQSGGRPIDRATQARITAIWTVLALAPLILVHQLHELSGLWIYPAAAASAWTAIFAGVTLKEYAEEAGMMWFHFRRDFHKNHPRLYRWVKINPPH